MSDQTNPVQNRTKLQHDAIWQSAWHAYQAMSLAHELERLDEMVRAYPVEMKATDDLRRCIALAVDELHEHREDSTND